MKRIASLLICAVMLFACIPFANAAEDITVISGNYSLVCEDADKIVIGDTVIKPEEDFEFEIRVTVSGAESGDDLFLLNGAPAGVISDGVNTLKFRISQLVEGKNTLGIRLGTSEGPFDFSMVYGTVNLDDLKIVSVEFVGIGFDTPESITKYMPTPGSAEVTAAESDYTADIAVGDGWYSETKLGGSTPDVPVACDFIFEKPSSKGHFNIDSASIPDGSYEIKIYSGDKLSETRKCVVDNTPPEIVFSLNNNGKVSPMGSVEYTVNDLTECTIKLLIDGIPAASIKPSKLDACKHTAYLTATDKAGNSSSEMLLFEVTDEVFTAEVLEKSVKMSVLGDAKVYSGTLATRIRMLENRNSPTDELTHLRYEDERLISFNDKASHTTTPVSGGSAYQSFVVDTAFCEDEDVVVSYSGTTGSGSDILLTAWNYKNSEWDTVFIAKSGVPATFKLKLEDYSYDDKIRVNASVYSYGNGSDTILWNSDTQYYTRYDDLNELYDSINNYAVEQYNLGNIAYCVHTGDLIDQMNAGISVARSQYETASKAQDILDSAGVPNGVVSGNHDVNHTVADYSLFCKYFGEERYEDFAWYGGSLDNNTHHYDLISVGDYDFVFLYLGVFKEADEKTIEWANAVCKSYPNRNVVICTHEYLLPSGAYSGDRAEIIWDNIVVPNENVMMLLCGHNDGVCDKLRRVEGTNRYVAEILADYQFAELNKGPQHVENGCTCDGEGFVRLMTFTSAGQLISQTYSPYWDTYNYFPSYQDSFVYDLSLIKADRSICTSDFNVMGNVKEAGNVGEDFSLKGCDAFYADITSAYGDSLSAIYVINDYTSDYIADTPAEYDEPEHERVAAGSLANVNENFRMGEENKKPDEALAKTLIDLLPDSIDVFTHVSGSKEFTVTSEKSGGYTLVNSADGSQSWTSVQNLIGEKHLFNKGERLYFGVTADKSAKWNIILNVRVNGEMKSINFARDEEVAAMFGYINALPSDVQGTWNGYIELSELWGKKCDVVSVYLTSALKETPITFDYLFIGSSKCGSVRLVSSSDTVTAYELPAGTEMQLPAAYLMGSTFDGWYTAKEGGEKVEKVSDVSGTLELYARFLPKTQATPEEPVYYDKEIVFEDIPYGKIIILSIIIIFVIIVIIVLRLKMKKAEAHRKNGGKSK